MKNYVYNNEFICTGKIQEIIKYLEYLSLNYTTVQQFIESKKRIIDQETSN